MRKKIDEELRRKISELRKKMDEVLRRKISELDRSPLLLGEG
jgi:hypothetical protein